MGVRGQPLLFLVTYMHRLLVRPRITKARPPRLATAESIGQQYHDDHSPLQRTSTTLAGRCMAILPTNFDSTNGLQQRTTKATPTDVQIHNQQGHDSAKYPQISIHPNKLDLTTGALKKLTHVMSNQSTINSKSKSLLNQPIDEVLFYNQTEPSSMVY
jgi:hypothetical protein